MFYLSALAQDFNTITKVRYIKLFPKYVEWPSNKQSGDFVIGVVGDVDIAKALTDAWANKTVGNQAVKVKQFANSSEIDQCHIVYLSSKNSSEIDKFSSKGKKQNTLILTEKEGLISKSQINFVFVDSKLKYQLNIKNITNFGLKVNDNLKAAAAEVIE